MLLNDNLKIMTYEGILSLMHCASVIHCEASESEREGSQVTLRFPYCPVIRQ